MAKMITGTVVSDKANKTIVVAVQTRKTHPLYKKQYFVTKKIQAHDEKNEAKVGDKVQISETRPISAKKHFKLDKITAVAILTSDQTVEAITNETETTDGEEK